MNVYALLPLIAVIAYIPLLITTICSRPWHKRHILFFIFLGSAIIWSLIDYLFVGNIFPQSNQLILKLLITFFVVVAVQFHAFLSSFYPADKGRWLPFAYVSLAVAIVLIMLGHITGDIIIDGNMIYGTYSAGVFVILACMLILVVRNYYIFIRMLKTLENPAAYNQIVTLIFCISVLLLFTLLSLLPFGRNFPLSHFGNLINAIILSYSVIRHHLVDIKLVLRQGTAWISLGIVGMLIFWLLLVTLRSAFAFKLDMTASFVATAVSLVVSIFIYKLRGYLFELMGRAFHGSSYEYRQKLTNFSNSIHNIFSLKEQGGELLTLLTKAIGIKQA